MSQRYIGGLVTLNPTPPNPALGNQGNGVFNMNQYRSLKDQNLWPAIDPYWRYVTLMLHGNGTNGSQNNTFLDSSTNNFTITRNGNTTQGTFSPYGSNWSVYVPSQSNNLSIASSANLASSTNSFTLEFWYNSTATGNGRPLGNGTGGAYGANNWVFGSNNTAGKLELFVYNYSTGTAILSSTSSTIASDGQWHHIAIVRSSNTWAMFIDGTRQGSTVTSSVSFNGTSSAFVVGNSGVGGESATAFVGYLSNVRFVNGTAVYDPTQTTITVPTGPLTAITNTSLLTCQSNRFIDNSSNAFTITVSGSPSVQRFSPFSPTAPYAAGTDGGSGYFDGSGDYLTVASNSVLNGSAFTLEGWFYYNAAGATNTILYSSTASGGIALAYQSGTTWGLAAALVAYRLTTTTLPTVNAWNHIVVARAGTGANQTSIFLNGTRVANGTVTDSFNVTATFLVGWDGNGTNLYFNGYIAGFRFVNSDVYGASNTTITVPTAPPTAITGTQLLLSYTNAGIIDNAEMNDLETVGNAQISTAQSKFGGGSLAFDGTGDYLTARTNPAFLFGTGDFTVEMWYYPSALTGTPGLAQALVGMWGTGTASWLLYLNSGNLYWYTSTDGSTQTATMNAASGMSVNNWYHLALCRSGGTTRIFVNGTSIVSTSTSVNLFNATCPLTVGYNPIGGTPDYVYGYIDDLRITKGYARYTANFTPQRSQWQDQ